MKSILLMLSLMLFVGTRLQADEPLPPAPTGFAWQRLTPIKSALLKPDGWFYKESTNANTQGFFISREDIDKVGAFKTGLTLDCIRDVTKKVNVLPSLYAAEIAKVAASKYTLLEKSSSQQGPFKAIRFCYVSSPTNQESVTVYHLMIANDKTGTLFIAIFESPTNEWKEAWKKGEVILKKMLLDDET
jgi:hypothetical protein